MSHSTQYSKFYWQLAEEDAGFGSTESPKGNMRFEIREGTCSIDINVQNLKPCTPDFCYKFYLISTNTNKFAFTCLGTLEIKNFKASLSNVSSVGDINKSMLSLNEFNAAVIAYQPNLLTSSSKLLFPLSAYKNEKVLWKNRLCTQLLPKVQAPSIKQEAAVHTYPSANSDTLANPSIEELTNTNFEKPSAKSTDNDESEISEKWNSFMQNMNFFADNSVLCYGMNPESQFSEQSEFKVKNLENMLSMSFPECKPIKKDDNMLRWWKINNHQLLKRILNSSDYPELFFASNYLNTSYYIYGYYTVSIETYDNLHLFVYGIPSLYGIDPKPSNVPCVWESESGNGELYGEFGYWLVKFDMINGGIV